MSHLYNTVFPNSLTGELFKQDPSAPQEQKKQGARHCL